MSASEIKRGCRAGRLSLFLSLGLAAALLQPAARSSALSPGSLVFDHISVESGLSQSSIFVIMQDRSGYLWFGTEDGLNRFDGYNFTVYRHRPRQPESISDNWISAIHEDQQGVLWVATRGGLDRFDRAASRFAHFPAPAPGAEMWCIHEDRTGHLWFGTDAGLYRLDRERGKFIWVPVLPGEPVGIRSILEDARGDLWLATWGAGLVSFDPARGTTVFHRHDDRDGATLSSDNVRTLFIDSGGTLWVGTDCGLDALVPKTRHFLHRLPAAGTPPVQITTLFEDEQKTLWVGSWGDGLVAISPDRRREVRLRREPANPQSLSHNTVWAILQDRSGVLWIGTGTGGGLNKLVVAPRFTHYRYAPSSTLSLSHDLVWAIHQDASGGLWVGTWDGLDFIDRAAGRVQHYRQEPGNQASLSSNRVWAIAEDDRGVLWLGTHDAGLNRLEPKTGKVTRFPLSEGTGSFGANAVRALLFDRGQALWIGTNGGGLMRLDRRGITRYRHNPNEPMSLGDDRVWALLEDRQGFLWIGTDGGGVDRFDPVRKTFTHYRHDPANPKSLGGDRVWSIHQHRNGSLWFGTQGGGLSELLAEAAGFQVFSEESSQLPNNTVYGILEDGSGRLWLSTNRGISCFDPATGKLVNFGMGQGLQSPEFNFGAYHLGHNGEMFFGGINGLNSFFPNELLQPRSRTPPVAITGFYRLGSLEREEIPSGSEIRLTHNDNFFSFSFAVLDFVAPQQNTYAYILEGVDNDWRLTDAGHRLASYTLVPPGRYTFRVRGANSSGTWNKLGPRLRIAIAPPFWRRTWFVLLTGLSLVAGGLMATVYSAARRRAVRQMLVYNREQERSTLAKEIHDGPIQDVANLSHRIEDLSEQIQKGLEPQAARRQMTALRLSLGEIGTSLRGTCWQLRPPALEELGLEPAMRDYLYGLEDTYPMPEVDFGIAFEGPPPSYDVQLQLFRIYQVAIHNLALHAAASKARVRLEGSAERIVLEISDNGRGFVRPRRLVEFGLRKHYGLLGAEERASSLGGTLTIDSTPGKGTVLRVVIEASHWGTPLSRLQPEEELP